MIWPFRKSETTKARSKKLEALEKVMLDQKAAAKRLQHNLRLAHCEHVNHVLQGVVPKFEKDDPQ